MKTRGNPGNDNEAIHVIGYYWTTRLAPDRDAAIVNFCLDGTDGWMDFDDRQLDAFIKQLQDDQRALRLRAATNPRRKI